MPTLQAGFTLKLAYDVVSTPNPIRASEPGVDPDTITLEVVVSNPSRDIVELSKIEIIIPIGQEISRDLTNSPDLPAPVPATSGPWTISAEAGTITIIPSDGDSAKVIAPIVFSLHGIVVNQTPGSVPLTITEFPLSDPKITDGSHTLVKQPSDYPVISFYADPASLTDLDQSVTLHWTCSDQGKLDAYGLRIDSVRSAPEERPSYSGAAQFANAGPAVQAARQNAAPFRNCVADGNCYTWQDGVNGVVTPVVNQTTTFALDIVQTDSSSGHGTVIASLTTTVDVTVPWISPNLKVEGIFGGRVLRLHWLAFNARACTVQVDGVTVDDNAPTDTYTNGYFCMPPTQDGERLVTVIAHAAVGSAQAPLTFPPQLITPMTRIDNIGISESVAITPDGKTALLGTSSDSDRVRFVDIGSRKLESGSILLDYAAAVAVAPPDGVLALCLTNTVVCVIDVPGRKAEPPTIRVDDLSGDLGYPWSIAITPDGKTALVGGNFLGSAIAVIDIPGRRVETMIPIGTSSERIAITPDGKSAFVLSSEQGTVKVVDLVKRAVEPTSIAFGNVVGDIAITPDGALAVVTNRDEASVSVINVAERKVETTIPTGPMPWSIAISPRDGALALVTNPNMTVTIIDIARRTSAIRAWGFSGAESYQTAVGITPDGTTALILGRVEDNEDNYYVVVI